ncbi:Hsp20/alpha crystallin family protein [Promethearchaeum syntrophicum]|uniref:Hsp20/alpha crystallin family protein n=1 Tax=Promethearchaeum syntrophicum TaxID=2594042 RepID=A0A5B9D9T6_9ARCH|nr:Hsp20/alpha crystallin family protein [Candidatus Prometheoarchaeum syntrophicum]QEE15853.1 Hsp20/alpha crystallin family protein [Candidatus Prometheoarchaeum syntrophicum]
MENLFDIIRKILEEYSGSIENSKDFSMSYTYNSGMDKPELKINGKTVNPELLKKLEKHMMEFQSNFSQFGNSNRSFLNNTEAFRKDIILPSKIPEISNGNNLNVVRDIFFDIFDEDEKLKIIIELPGVKKHNIQLQAASREIEIKTPHHHKIIQLPVPVNNSIAKARYSNGILDIELEKIVRSKKKAKKLQID